MQVNLSASVQFNYYFFEVLNPKAKPSLDDNITTPKSVAFSGTGPLWSNNFTWTSYLDANVPSKGFKWEFRGKGTMSVLQKCIKKDLMTSCYWIALRVLSFNH